MKCEWCGDEAKRIVKAGKGSIGVGAIRAPACVNCAQRLFGRYPGVETTNLEPARPVVPVDVDTTDPSAASVQPWE